MAAQIFKDPYIFDFLGTADPRREAELEQKLIDHEITFAIFENIINDEQQSVTLATACDELLPKLMSGELEV